MKNLTSKSLLTAKLLKNETVSVSVIIIMIVGGEVVRIRNLIIGKLGKGYRIGYKCLLTGKRVKVEKLATLAGLKRAA